MDYVLSLNGGIGKHIMYSSLVKWINEKFPESKITVISAYPEIFENNPRIYRNLPMQQAYLFTDYIQGRDFRTGDPYTREEYFRETNKMHFNEIIPQSFGFNEYNQTPKNEIFLTNGERAEFAELERKKVVTLQISGGVPMGLQMNIREKIDSNGRDMPLNMAMSIVNILRMRGYEVIQVRGQTEQIIPGTTQLGNPQQAMNFRNVLGAGIHCKGHIGIDSSFMHAISAFEKPMLIFWGNTSPDNLGYKYPKVMNIRKQNAKNIPNVGMPDRMALFPRTDSEKESYWVYSNEELQKTIEEFIKSIEHLNISTP